MSPTESTGPLGDGRADDRNEPVRFADGEVQLVEQVRDVPALEHGTDAGTGRVRGEDDACVRANRREEDGEARGRGDRRVLGSEQRPRRLVGGFEGICCHALLTGEGADHVIPVARFALTALERGDGGHGAVREGGVTGGGGDGPGEGLEGTGAQRDGPIEVEDDGRGHCSPARILRCHRPRSDDASTVTS